MTAIVAAALLALALADGSFAGFRSSAGRTGLIRHRQSDLQAARRGVVLACALLTPAIGLASADALTHPAHLDDYVRAGTAMLAVYGPYGLLVLSGLAVYAAMNWRLAYLASALIIGPLALLRRVIAIAGAALAAALSHDATVAGVAGLAVVAVLAVEPLAGRLWYAKVTSRLPSHTSGR
jgi:hypothetical protein